MAVSETQKIERIASALQDVQARIEAACARVDRAPGSVTLVAVSKTQPFVAVEAGYAAGQRDFGENRLEVVVKGRGGAQQRLGQGLALAPDRPDPEAARPARPWVRSR